MFNNKKADIDLSLKTIISLVIAAIFLFALFWLIYLIYSSFIPKPDIATQNTFDQILVPAVEKATGEEKFIPYYIQPDSVSKPAYELVSRIADKACCDKCLCIREEGKKGSFYKIKKFKFNIQIDADKSKISGRNHVGPKPYDGNVRNVKIWKEGNYVHIKEN